MKRFFWTIVFAVGTWLLLPYSHKVHAQTSSDYAGQSSTSIGYIENKGQWDGNILFLARCNGYNAWVTKKGVVFDFVSYSLSKSDGLPQEDVMPLSKTESIVKKGHVVEMFWHNGKAPVDIKKNGRNAVHHNYYLGTDSRKWTSGVGIYNELLLKNIWSGTDIRLYMENGLLRYDFIVTGAQSSYKQIALRFAGADGISIEKGELHIATSLGVIAHGGLTTFAFSPKNKKNIDNSHGVERTEFPSSYLMDKSNVVRFMVHGDKAPQTNIVIDPYVYQTYLGGSQRDRTYDMKILSNGSAVITGTTESSNYPTAVGAYDVSYNPNSDVIISCLNPAGTDLLWSTYLGNSSSTSVGEYGLKLLIVNDEVFCAGIGGNNFPITPGVCDPIFNGSIPNSFGDGFLTKFSSIGSLIFSTFIGGNGIAWPFGMALASDGGIVLAGLTPSLSPAQGASGYDLTYNGGASDYFVAKISANGATRVWCTLLGGTGSEGNYTNENHLVGVAVLSSGEIIVAGGGSTSTDLPISAGFQTTSGGGEDIYAAKLSANGLSLLSATYIGGSGNEQTHGIDIDATDNVFITGRTSSANFPTSAAGYDRTFTGSVTNAFLVKLPPSLASLSAGTYIGSDLTVGYDVAVAKNTGSVYISGNTGGPATFPTTPDAHAPAQGTGVVARLDNNLTTLQYASYNTTRSIFDIETNQAGNKFWMTGFSEISGMIVTPGAYDVTINGSDDIFVGAVCWESWGPVGGGPKTICEGDTVVIGVAGQPGDAPEWTPALRLDNPLIAQPKAFPVVSRTYRIVVRNGGSCPISDSVVMTVNPRPIVPIDSMLSDRCFNDEVVYVLPRNYAPGHTYKWDIQNGLIIGADNQKTVRVRWNQSGSNRLSAVVTSPFGCKATATLLANVNPELRISILPRDTTMCFGKGFRPLVAAFGGTPPYSYVWNNASGLSSTTISNPVVAPQASGKYVLTITDSKGCKAKDSVVVTVSPPISAVIGPDVLVCFGESAALTVVGAGGMPPLNYSWKANGVPMGVNSDMITVFSQTTTQYIGTVTDQALCSASDTILVIVNPKISTDAGKDIQLCEGEQSTLSAQAVGGVGPMTFSWQPATGLSSATIPNPVFTGTSTGTFRYVVTVVDSKKCKGFDTVDIIVGSPPKFSFQPIVFPDLNGCTANIVAETDFTNVGNDPLTISAIDIAEAEFQYVNSSAPIVNIQPGQTVQLRFRFQPSNQGTVSGKAKLTLNPCNVSTEIPLMGTKNGVTFTTPDTVDVGSILPCSQSFGEVRVALKNGSGGNVSGEVEDIALGNGASTNLQKGSTVNSGDSIVFYIRLSAPKGTPPGQLNSFVTVTMSPCDIDKTIVVRGEVATAEISATLPLDFGQMKIGSKKSATALFVNSGSVPLAVDSISGVSSPFVLLSTNPVLPAILQPGATLYANIECTADVVGTKRIDIQAFASAPCSLSATMEVVAVFSDSPVASLSALDYIFSRSLLAGETLTENIEAINDGDLPITVSSVELLTNPEGVFRTEFFSPQTLAPNSRMTIPLTFSPNIPVSVGIKIAQLLIIGDKDSAICTVRGTVVNTVPPSSIVISGRHFGAVSLQTSRDTTLWIKTTSVVPTTVVSVLATGGDMADFEIVGFVPTSLKSPDSLGVIARFTPQSIGLRSATITATAQPNNLIATSIVEGIGASSSAAFSIGSYAAYPGDEIVVNISLASEQNLTQSGADAVEALLTMNASLLEPINGNQKGSVVAGMRKIPIRIPLSPSGNEILQSIRLVACLGNDSVTSIALESVDVLGKPLSVSSVSGEFRLLGICRIGGARLFDAQGVAAHLSAFPTPSDGKITTEISVSEAGEHAFLIYSSDGLIHRNIGKLSMVKGNHTLNFDLGEILDSGLYFFIVETPTQRFSAPLIIVK